MKYQPTPETQDLPNAPTHLVLARVGALFNKDAVILGTHATSTVAYLSVKFPPTNCHRFKYKQVSAGYACAHSHDCEASTWPEFETACAQGLRFDTAIIETLLASALSQLASLWLCNGQSPRRLQTS